MDMPWISRERVEEAKKMDALAWLMMHEPWELVQISPGYYTTKTHGSLKLDHGLWDWHAKGIGGRSAVDYLIKVKGMCFQDAVLAVLGDGFTERKTYDMNQERAGKDGRENAKAEQQELILPERDSSNHTAVRYLLNRGISEKTIRYFISEGVLYQEKRYKNIVFLGKDYNGTVKSAYCRGTGGRFHHIVAGSSRVYPFRSTHPDNEAKLHLFEAPVDMLSYGTLYDLAGLDFKSCNMMSLCGVWKSEKNINEAAMPKALLEYLAWYPDTEEVVLHFDNDDAGRGNAEIIKGRLTGVRVTDDPPPGKYKDVNDYLMALRKGGRKSE